MGAVQFLSDSSGVGITAESFPCFRRVNGGIEVGLQAQRARLADTSDGGLSWRLAGVIVPVGPVSGGVAAEQVVARSRADVWAIVGKGRLVATQNGGSDWQAQTIPTPAVAIATSAGSVWAVTCPPRATRTSPLACRPQLWRTRSTDDTWARMPIPRVVAQDPSTVHLAATPKDIVIALVEAGNRPRGELLVSDDGGLRWTERPAPSWEHNRCDIDAALTAHAPRTFWLLCLGGAAAGSSTKGLLRSTDAVRRWRTDSAVTSLVAHAEPGSIPLAEPSALAAGSDNRLWLSLINCLAESNDGGHHWTYPRSVNPYGWETVLDVLDANEVWLLAPGAGVWRTSDGVHWRAVGPLNTR